MPGRGQPQLSLGIGVHGKLRSLMGQDRPGAPSAVPGPARLGTGVGGQGVKGHRPLYPGLAGVGAGRTRHRPGFLAGRLLPSHLAAVRLLAPLRCIPEVVFSHNCTRRRTRHICRDSSLRVRGTQQMKGACAVLGLRQGYRGGVDGGVATQGRGLCFGLLGGTRLLGSLYVCTENSQVTLFFLFKTGFHSVQASFNLL